MAATKRNLKNKNQDADQRTFIVAIVLAAVACTALVIAAFCTGSERGGDGASSNLSDVGGSDAVPETDTEDDTGHGSEESAGITVEIPGNVTDASDQNTDTEDNIIPPDTQDGISVTLETKKLNQSGAEIVMIYPKVERSAPASSYSPEAQNNAIREYMDERRRVMCIGMSGDEYEYIVEKTEFRYVGESFFSALVTGHFYLKDSSHPTMFAYAVNFDSVRCSVLSGEDLIRDFSRVRDSFINGKFKLIHGMDGLLDETGYEDMIMEYMPDYGRYPEVYYTENGFGLALDLVYTLGGYALFEIPRTSLGDAVYAPPN